MASSAGRELCAKAASTRRMRSSVGIGLVVLSQLEVDKGEHLSQLVEEAVREKLFDLTVAEVTRRNAGQTDAVMQVTEEAPDAHTNEGRPAASRRIQLAVDRCQPIHTRHA